MLYSSVIPFYEANDLTLSDWQHITFASMLKLDERNDYAFKVPYKRILYFDRAKDVLNIPSFYIYTGIEYNSALPIRCEGIKIIFNDGSFVLTSNTAPYNQSFEDFRNNIVLDIQNNQWLLVSEPTSLRLNSESWPLGPVSIVLQLMQPNAVDYYYYYSDRLYITDDIHNYIELSWSNNTNLAIGNRIIPYELGYRPSCYVDTLLGKPEYTFEEEIIDRLGYKFVQSAISKKVYRCAFSAPEYLCDSLRIMRICNNKLVTRYDFPNFGESIEPMVMTMDVNWDDQGHLALVDMSFEVDLVAANPSGYIPLRTGDFNNDYNSDFDNT